MYMTFAFFDFIHEIRFWIGLLTLLADLADKGKVGYFGSPEIFLIKFDFFLRKNLDKREWVTISGKKLLI